MLGAIFKVHGVVMCFLKYSEGDSAMGAKEIKISDEESDEVPKKDSEELFEYMMSSLSERLVFHVKEAFGFQ